jgi:hypothetical protein
MAELAEQKREQYAPHNRPFHDPAANAREAHKPFLAGLTERENVVALVHESDGEVDGFVVAMIGPVPPVYDVGGLSSLVDDFVVAVDALELAARPTVTVTSAAAVADRAVMPFRSMQRPTH